MATPRPDPESGPPLPSPSSDERWQALDSAWALETDDAHWSREMYDYMAETAQAIHIEPSAIQSVACKTTVCRLRLAFPSLMDANEFQEAANPAYHYELRGLPTPEGESLAQYDVLVSRTSEPPPRQE